MDESSTATRPPRARRPPGRFITAITVLALACAVYALYRLERTRDRFDELRDEVRALSTSGDLLRSYT